MASRDSSEQGRTGPYSDSSDFESGIDYGAYLEDEATDEPDPPRSADQEPDSVMEDHSRPGRPTEPIGVVPGQSSSRSGARRPVEDTGTAEPTEALPRGAGVTREPQETRDTARGPAVAGRGNDDDGAGARAPQDTAGPSSSTQSINRSELAALAAQDSTNARAGGSATGSTATGSTATGSTSVTATADAGSYGVPAAGSNVDQEVDRRRDLRDAEARAAARDEALAGSPAGPRVLQVLLTLTFPLVLLIAAVRAVASPAFLWLEYHRPGFPEDPYGFTTEDRLTYGSAGMDYLFNAAPARYLAEFGQGGQPLFSESEISHMTDVKVVMMVTMAAGVLLAILSIIMMISLARTAKGGIRRALFAGSVWLLVALVVLAVLAALGWQQFFAAFHSLFFAEGTWTFAASDTLIRLYPNQFWIDAGIGLAALVLLTLVITLICTWPTRRRRTDARFAQTQLIRRRNYWAEDEGRVES